jgi:adenylate kinase family enzyme
LKVSQVQRVLIIGPCGSGKSTLAFTLGRRLGLPVHHMDQLGWLPGWVEADKGQLREQIIAIVAAMGGEQKFGLVRKAVA